MAAAAAATATGRRYEIGDASVFYSIFATNYTFLLMRQGASAATFSRAATGNTLASTELFGNSPSSEHLLVSQSVGQLSSSQSQCATQSGRPPQESQQVKASLPISFRRSSLFSKGVRSPHLSLPSSSSAHICSRQVFL